MGFMVLHGIEWDDMLLEWGSMGLFGCRWDFFRVYDGDVSWESHLFLVKFHGDIEKYVDYQTGTTVCTLWLFNIAMV